MPTAYVMRMTRGALSPTNQVTPVDLRGHVTLVHKSGEFILLETSLAGTSRKWQLFPTHPPPLVAVVRRDYPLLHPVAMTVADIFHNLAPP